MFALSEQYYTRSSFLLPNIFLDCRAALVWFHATLLFCEHYHTVTLLQIMYSLARNDVREVLRYKSQFTSTDNYKPRLNKLLPLSYQFSKLALTLLQLLL